MAQIPGTIGRYQIVSVIGRGGMGVLYKAKDPTLERDVALKMMLVDFSTDQTARERFEREAKAVARLQHHNVVTIHELGQNDGAPYIVMELLSGQDLEGLLRGNQPLPLASKLEIVAQLCEGLAYAHEQGIVHRDIKPGNVRVLEDGTVKILDFGIAKFAQSSMTQSGMIMGTAHYMAPEQILGNPIDGRADLFSVGVLLHELLSGKKPFAGDSPTAVVYQIVHGEAPSVADSVPGLPEGLNDIVARALKKDPNERYNSASDMAADLRLVKMMLDLPLSPNPTGAFDVTIRPQQQLHATAPMTRLSKTPAPGGARTGELLSGGPRTGAGTPPVSQPKKANTGLFVGVGAGVVVLGALAFFLFGNKTGETPTAQTPVSTAAATPPPVQTAAPAKSTSAPPAASAAGVALVVTSVPTGARITYNGADTGKATPAAIAVDPKAPGTVELSLKGYDSISAKLADADVKKGNKELHLVRQPSPVRLTVNGPYPFELRRGGAVLSPMAAHHDLTVPPGSDPVVAHNAEYILSEPVAIDFQKAEADATIKPAGVLAVFASVETCSILVDGVDIGFPPIPRKNIASGPHTVMMKCKDGKEDSRKITIIPGERLPVTFVK